MEEKLNFNFNGDSSTMYDEMFDAEDLIASEEKEENNDVYIKKDEISDKENEKRFIKSLSPEYKVDVAYAMTTKQLGRELYGREKRMMMRKLLRDAKNGKLDKYLKLLNI